MTTNLKTPGLAPATSPTLEALGREQDFLADLRILAHSLLLSASNLDATERQYLHDVGRENDVRYPMKNIQRLCDLSRRSRNPSHQGQFASLVRKHSGIVDTNLDVVLASNRETEAQGKADIAVRTFEQHPTPITKRLAEEAVHENEAAEQQLRAAIHQTRVA